MLDWDVFTRVVDEAGPSLVRIDFFNYGEAFLHKRAVEMCEYIKAQVPAHLSLHQHQRSRAQRGEGAPPGALGHRRGHVLDRRRLAGDLRAISPARQVRRRDRQPAGDGRREGHERPRRAAAELALHPVQVERQRRRDGAGAAAGRRKSASIGCAGRSPIIPRIRSRAGSSPGSPELERIRHEIWDNNNLGNAIPGATPRAQIDVRHWLPALPLKGRASQSRWTITTRVRNLSTRPFRAQASYGRRLVRLGAQLLDERRRDAQSRPRARLAARRHRRPAAAPTCRSRSPRRRRPGRYTLKFDLVSEGIDWFEACGSETTVKDADRSLSRAGRPDRPADLLDLRHHPQQIAAPQLGDLLLGVAATHQLQRDVERLARVVPAVDAAAAVEVRRDADVIDANQLDE